jgi:hypothetical protein
MTLTRVRPVRSGFLTGCGEVSRRSRKAFEHRFFVPTTDIPTEFKQPLGIGLCMRSRDA